MAALAAVWLSSCSGTATESAPTVSAPTTGSADHGADHDAAHNTDDVAFAQMMIPHHQQAVELSAMVPERSTDPEVLALATRISGQQQPEIDAMTALLKQWQVDVSDHGSNHAGMPMAGMVSEDTMIRLESLRGRDFDVLWLQSMIGHHQGAIEMAEVEVKEGKNPELLTLAKSIITAQQAEIDQMKTMLAAAGG